MFKHTDRQIIVNITSKTVIRILALTVATLLMIVFIRNVSHPLVLIFTSFFLALALNPAVSKITSGLPGRSRVLATGAAYLIVLGFLTAFIAFVVPPLVQQTIDFVKDVPGSVQEYKREDSPVNGFIEKYNLGQNIDRLTRDFSAKFSDLGGPVLSTAGVIGSTVLNVLIVLVLTFMMLIEGPRWIKRFWETQPVARRAYRKDVADRMYHVVTHYVNGQVLIAALGGLFATIVLFILSQIFDAPVNAIALGGIISLFALLPLIGTILGSVIVVLACMLVSFPLALSAAIYFIIYQQIENVTLQPYIQSRGNHLTPLLVFISALLGVGIGGFLGAFVAIPVAGCIKILAEEYFKGHPRST